MRRALVAVLGIVFVLAVWTATAAADPGQTAGQANTSGQSAGSLAGAGQAAPSNTAVGIRVLSPGDDGDVSQSNDVSATSGAVNLNGTGQSIDQSQGGSGTQVAGQESSSEQSADAAAIAAQKDPSNTAVGIRVLSPGDGGDVSQSNSADAGALAANGNLTGQSVDQSQGAAPTLVPCGCQSGGGTQVAGEDNASEQSADAGGLAVQDEPSNTAVGIRVLSPGDDGDVSQSNSADAGALAANGNLTGQSVDQSQGAAPCGCGGTQVAGQDNAREQSADAGAIAAQDKPSNTAVGIRVLSPGDGGDVSQSNDASARAAGLNLNGTGQSVDQSQGGSGTQVAGQESSSGQSAHAGAIAAQDKPSNTAVGIRVLSPGDDGDVSQSNSADAGALAANGNFTHQTIDQAQGGAPCGCGGTQVAGQSNGSLQAAGGLAVAAQDRPSNTAVGIRVLSPGDGGDVSQSNSADAGALAANGNFTHQAIDQTQGGSPSCGCGHGGTQVAGQSNASGQAAFAAALGLQLYPSNTATTTSVGYGGGCGCNSHVAAPAPSTPGNVTQSNDVSAHALALNLDLTGQSIHQAGSGTQVAGQRNANLQGAAAIAAALQFGAANRAP